MWIIIILAGLAVAYFFRVKVSNEVKKDGPLDDTEKLIVIVTEILSPILAGAIYYYGWKNKFPKKASQANKYSWIVFLILLVIGFFYGES